MQPYAIHEPVTVAYITADSFPEGIKPAFQALHTIVPFSAERKYFGYSRPEGTAEVVYKAAAELLHENEAEQLNLPVMVIPEGNYSSIRIENYMDDIAAISKAFDELLTHPDLDPDGFCLEYYVSNKELICLVPLKAG